MRALFVSYDIPDRAKIANPSGKLRHIGVRVNLSVWIIPEHLCPWELLENLALAGASYHVVRFDEGEKGKLRRMASDAIHREAGLIRESMHKSITRATAALTNLEARAVDGPALEKVREKHVKALRAVVNRAARLIAAAEEAAVAFDLMADVSEALRSTRDAVAAETKALIAAADGDAPELVVTGNEANLAGTTAAA